MFVTPMKSMKKDQVNTKIISVRNYSPSLVAKQVFPISRDNKQKPRSKVLGTDSAKFVTSYNPVLLNINSLINKYLPILHADLDLKEIFPRKLLLQFIEGKKSQRNVSNIFVS